MASQSFRSSPSPEVAEEGSTSSDDPIDNKGNADENNKCKSEEDSNNNVEENNEDNDEAKEEDAYDGVLFLGSPEETIRLCTTKSLDERARVLTVLGLLFPRLLDPILEEAQWLPYEMCPKNEGSCLSDQMLEADNAECIVLAAIALLPAYSSPSGRRKQVERRIRALLANFVSRGSYQLSDEARLLIKSVVGSFSSRDLHRDKFVLEALGRCISYDQQGNFNSAVQAGGDLSVMYVDRKREHFALDDVQWVLMVQMHLAYKYHNVTVLQLAFEAVAQLEMAQMQSEPLIKADLEHLKRHEHLFGPYCALVKRLPDALQPQAFRNMAYFGILHKEASLTTEEERRNWSKFNKKSVLNLFKNEPELRKEIERFVATVPTRMVNTMVDIYYNFNFERVEAFLKKQEPAFAEQVEQEMLRRHPDCSFSVNRRGDLIEILQCDFKDDLDDPVIKAILEIRDLIRSFGELRAKDESKVKKEEEQ